MRTKDILMALRSAGLTQTQIARLTGIPQPRLSRWESGDIPNAADDSLALADLHRQLVLSPPTTKAKEMAA